MPAHRRAAAALIKDRKLSCEELVRSCLERISTRDRLVPRLAASRS